MRHRPTRTPIVLLVVALLAGLIVPRSAAQDPSPEASPLPNVYVEAVDRANLRLGPGIEYPVVGEIGAGAYYRVLARHEFVPWLRIDWPGSSTAWVYQDVVTVTGDLNTLPLDSAFPFVVTLTPTPRIPRTATPTAPSSGPTTAAETADPDATPPPPDAPEASPTSAGGGPPAITPEATATIAGPTVTVLSGPTNVRYGPGIEYPLIASYEEGASFQLTGIHAIVPWVEIAVPSSPNGRGWVYRDLVQIEGDTASIPVISSFNFTLPDLTPTPQTVVVAPAPWADASAASGALAQSLGEAINAYLLEQEFDPHTRRFGSVFLMDLDSGDAFTLNDGVAYSGMSLTKIPILVTYFQQHDGPLSNEEAFLIADTMMCSENITTNALLEDIGEGDGVIGAQRVTKLMQDLGLRRIFMTAPYTLREDEERPVVGTVTTDADQVRAAPDPYNQITPKDLGFLLAGLYQCAQDGTGLLTERFPDDFTVQECRQMLRAMDANEIGVFIEAGVPDGVTVMHKHGWIDDTHGDAGIVIGPGGAYVLVVVLHSDEWLLFDQTSPTIAELSRLAWNWLNPDTPLDEVHMREVPAECNPRQDPVMRALLEGELPPPGPVVAQLPEDAAESPAPTGDADPAG